MGLSGYREYTVVVDGIAGLKVLLLLYTYHPYTVPYLYPYQYPLIPRYPIL